MSWYVEAGRLRSRQIATDVTLVVWCAAWLLLSTRLHDLLAQLARPGLAAADAGRALTDVAGRGDRLADLPLVGEVLQAPLDAVADGGRALVVAGTAQAEVATSLALWLSVLVFLLPVLGLGVPAVRWRRRTLTRARAAAHVRAAGAGPELFALRALTLRPLEDLRKVHPDPYGAFAEGRYEELARLELQALGLRTRPGPGSGGS